MLLARAALGHRYAALPGMSADVVWKEARGWLHSGQVGLVLHLLHAHLEAALPGQVGKKDLRGRAYREADGDWRDHTARLLLSDGVIELARQVNRPLHRKLVMALIAGTAKGEPEPLTRQSATGADTATAN